MTRYSCTRSELILLVAYTVSWLLPILLALCIVFSGKYFSNVGKYWQFQNIVLIASSTVLAGIFTLVTGWATLLKVRPLFELHIFDAANLHIMDRIVIGAFALISGIGLFHSFDGTIFEKSYLGPVKAWHGIGAWSVFFNLTVFLLVCDYLKNTLFSLRLFGFYILITSPFLLCGSRIDFLSGMVAIFVLCCVDTRNRLSIRIQQLSIMIPITLVIINAVGIARYHMHEINQHAPSALTSLVTLSSDRVYLSTIGDIAASIFQAFGQLERGDLPMVGFWESMQRYLVRLLPGIWFPDRPSDLLLLFPELPGGGALHALGEGYLIGGYGGIIFIAGIIGIVLGCSIAAKSAWHHHGHACFGLIFLFPWLLLIRGGWYQFFSIIKSLEIMGLIIVGLAMLVFLRNLLGHIWRR